MIKNMIMVGLSGSGKSAVGKSLAWMMSCGHIDLDHLIEKHEKISVAEFFAQHGEESFRKVEDRTLQRLRKVENHVLSLGAGSLQSQRTLDLVKSLGMVVWLDVPPSILAKRLSKNKEELKRRPLLADLSPEQLEKKLQEMLIERRRGYEESDLVLSESYASAQHCALFLKNMWLYRSALIYREKTLSL
ncbi:MAG: shikimate kinase [Oligoflexales bacterium]|nr:shikimate kinase [Oligoflexales bacterium]